MAVTGGSSTAAPGRRAAPAHEPADGEVRPGDALGAVHRLIEMPARLQLVAQPIVDLRTGAAAGWELLTRVPAAWSVPPDVLFATAREHGVSGILHERVVSEALRLRDDLPDNTFLTVNIDPVDVADPAVLDVLFASASLARIVVEVTEHAWPTDRTPIDEAIAEIRARGAQIAADDVGAGYAGLNQLMRLRPDFVKVDRELVETLGHDPAAEALVTAIGHLSGSLDAWVIVEGVETELQLAALNRLGVPLGQGWLLGRPGPPWPAPAAAGLVRHRQALSEITDSVRSLLRPVSRLYTRDGHGRYWHREQDYPCVTVAPATSLKEAVQRSLSRPPATRWTPLLVTDAEGAVLGEVVMEDLVSAVAGREPYE